MPTSIQVHKMAAFTGHRDCIYALATDAPAREFYTSGADGMVVRWQLDAPDQGTLVARVPQTCYALCLIPDSGVLVVGSNFDGIHLIDLSGKQAIRSVQLTQSAIFDIRYAQGHLIVATGDGTLHWVSYPDLQVVRRVQASEAAARAVAVHPHKPEVAVGFSDHLVRVYQLPDWQLLHTLEAHTNSVFALSYSPNGAHLLSGGRDAHLMVWQPEAGYALQEKIVAHLFTINHIAFREAGDYFATCSKDKSIKIWENHTFQLRKVIDRGRHAGHGTSVNKVSWLGNEFSLVSCSDDRSASAWQLAFDNPS